MATKTALFDSAFLRQLHEEQTTYKFNERLCLIKRAFTSSKFLGIEEEALLTNPYYYHDMFNKMYDCDMDELYEIEQSLDLLCHHLKQSTV